MSEARTPPIAGGSGELLRVSVETRGSAVIVAAVGELDLMTVPALSQALAEAWEASPGRLVLDIGAVTFLASVGMTVLAEHHQRGQQQDVPFIVVTDDRATLRTLQLTGMTDLLTIAPDLAAALDRG